MGMAPSLSLSKKRGASVTIEFDQVFVYAVVHTNYKNLVEEGTA